MEKVGVEIKIENGAVICPACGHEVDYDSTGEYLCYLCGHTWEVRDE